MLKTTHPALVFGFGAMLSACGTSGGQTSPPGDGGPDARVSSGSGGNGSVFGGSGGGQSSGGTSSSGGASNASGGASRGGTTSSGGGNPSSGGASAGGASSDAGGSTPAAWLKIVGTKIETPDGKPFHGRGANLHDTRSCNACTFEAPNPAGLEAWSDELIDQWHANFIRFDLEAYATAQGRTQWQSLIDDAGYYADIQTVVNHMTSKPGVYVMVTLFTDPSQVPDGQTHAEWPTDATLPVYKKLAEAFYKNPQVLFGLMNEPHDDASQNSALAAMFTKCIQQIRDVEKSHGTPQHIVVAQASQGYARDLSYWVANPLTVEGGTNIAYETHPYNSKSDFDSLFVQPSKKIPVIIGEFGPATVGGTVYMTNDDASALMDVAETNEIPYIAWNFHQRCPPNLIEDTGGNGYDGCGFIGAGTIYKWPPTDWGTLFKNRLAQPY